MPQTIGMSKYTLRDLFWLTLVVALAVGWWADRSRLRQRPFNAAVWRDEESIQKGARLAMADDLVARQLLSGMSRAEVIAMLGKPPATDYFANWELVYWLGPERGFISIDSEWLVVMFDTKGRVSQFRMLRD